jgi:nucleoside-diphosphate-sugar epimerase
MFSYRIYNPEEHCKNICENVIFAIQKNNMSTKILIIGACGQIGTELTHSLRKIYGTDKIASDIRKPNNDVVNSGPFEVINALISIRLSILWKFIKLMKSI